MANQKEIKRRIKSTKNIGQITKALQMVSAVKMRKAQSSLQSSRPYNEMINEVFLNLLAGIGKEQIQELLESQRKKKNNKNNIAMILISPSRGFAGPLISNLSRKALEFIEKRGSNQKYENEEFVVFNDAEDTKPQDDKINIKLITVEKKSKDFAIRVSKDVIADFPRLSNPPVFEDIIPITDIVLDEYKDGSLDEVYIIYTHFLTTFSQKAVIKRVLPFNYEKALSKSKAVEKVQPWYTFSEDQIKLFSEFYPVFVETQLYHAVLDAVAAEHSARMIAMKNATDNAIELRKQLVFEYNQKRQAAITQEIAEITSAADTL